MPSIVTHYLMGESCFNTLDNNQRLKRIIDDNYQIFAFACNGPDLFFYYNVYPWLDQNKAKEVAKIGSALHEEKINEFFECALHHVKYSGDEKMVAYMAGLLCHYCLDRVCHPFIFYYTSDHSGTSDYYHRNMESNIDSLMLKKIKNQTVKDFKVQSIVAYDQKDVDAIYNFYAYPIREVYGIEISYDLIHKCMKYFFGLQKHLYDPKGIKWQISKLYEDKLHALSNPISMIVPINYKDSNDLLNLKHDVWFHPVTQVASTDSFLDLFTMGYQDGVDLLTLFEEYLSDDGYLNNMLRLIDNRSYDTGLPYLAKMEYFAVDEGKQKCE